jgi:hypothetical protein
MHRKCKELGPSTGTSTTSASGKRTAAEKRNAPAHQGPLARRYDPLYSRPRLIIAATAAPRNGLLLLSYAILPGG